MRRTRHRVLPAPRLYFKDRIEAGRRRFDFLRGQERYKYEWGAVDEPIYRLLVERAA